jgi:hypothetical protein
MNNTIAAEKQIRQNRPRPTADNKEEKGSIIAEHH